MELRKIIGLIGAALLVIGAFCPILKVPFLGTISYFGTSGGYDGMYIIILAVLSLALILYDKSYRMLWITGGIPIAMVVYTVITFQSKVNEVKAQIDTELKNNLFKGVIDMMIQSVQLQFGIAVIGIAAVMLIVAACMKREVAKEPIIMEDLL